MNDHVLDAIRQKLGVLGEPRPGGTEPPKGVTAMPVWRWLLDRELIR